MKTRKFGIISYENYKDRVLDIASGKYKPNAEEPKIWFESSDAIRYKMMKIGQSMTDEEAEQLANEAVKFARE